MASVTITTLTALEAALASSIATIVPTFVADGTPPGGSGPSWIYAEDRRELAPTLVPRRFFFEWGSPDVVLGGATGNLDTETGVDMTIVADYREFREEDLGTVVESDFWDLHDRMSNSLDPIVAGLMRVTGKGLDPRAAQQVGHKFRIQYMRAWRG